jgi:uncharacterized membrane protein YfcA
MVNLFLGSKHTDSIVGIKMCTWEYWMILCAFLGLCIVAVFVGTKWSKEEQALRKKCKMNYSEDELQFDKKTTCQLLTIGFVGGWIAGALGLGGGSIYNPALLTMGIHPRVAGSTGMYLVLFSVINSNAVYLINGIL